MKPKLNVEPTASTEVSGEPLYYDSGVLYDDPEAYYDRWYPVSNLSQGESPKMNIYKEGIFTKTKEETVTIREVEEF